MLSERVASGVEDPVEDVYMTFRSADDANILEPIDLVPIVRLPSPIPMLLQRPDLGGERGVRVQHNLRLACLLQLILVIISF